MSARNGPSVGRGVLKQLLWVGIAALLARLLPAPPRRTQMVPQSLPLADATSAEPARAAMADQRSGGAERTDAAPGEHPSRGQGESGMQGYAIGLALAALLTAGSFYLSTTKLIWPPGVPIALIVFAVAQIGVHLVFFLHLTTGAENVNNSMALAFGVLIMVLLIGGSLWIMSHLNANMTSMPMVSISTGMGP